MLLLLNGVHSFHETKTRQGIFLFLRQASHEVFDNKPSRFFNKCEEVIHQSTDNIYLKPK
ncbi:MAG: hypothetical protein JWO30_2260 [Fibrobacteres bacterium]|nr:hypothetical protein [Fibrobacterota bacterium]